MAFVPVTLQSFLAFHLCFALPGKRRYIIIYAGAAYSSHVLDNDHVAEAGQQDVASLPGLCLE